MKPKSTPCKCQAYPFPHRIGGGKCTRKTSEPSFFYGGWLNHEGWDEAFEQKYDR